MVKKIRTSIAIYDDVWKNAKRSGLNISREINDFLRARTSGDPEMMKAISTCRLCNVEKTPRELFIFHGLIEIEDMGTWTFICKDCFRDVIDGIIKHDKELSKLILKEYQEELEKISGVYWTRLAEQRLKDESLESLSDYWKSLLTKKSIPFENSIGQYEGNPDSLDCLYMSTKELLKLIKETPLARWKFEPGHIQVLLKEVYPQ